MSIDRQLALRNNMSPQQLMQRYSVSNELLDLLALQKMQSEIAAKKRDQMAQMGQQPGTIKEQKEREVFQAVREEVAPIAQRAQQVTAAEQQKQLQQQRAMQMLAQSMQQQGGPGAPMMSGIASAPAPNMRMAQGGIVGYAKGDLITNSDDGLKDLIERAMMLGASRNDLSNLLARSGKTLEELGFTAPETSESAPGIGTMRFQESSPEAMSEAVNAVPMANRNVALPASMEEQITQVLAQRPDVDVPRGSSLMAPSTETRSLANALEGSPAEQRAMLARELDRQIEELGGSQRGRIGSTRALSQEAQERIARINELERDKLRLLAAGRDPEKIQATVDAIAGRRPYSTRPVGEMAERALPAGREGRSSEDIASMIATAMGQQAPQLTPTMEM